MTKATGGKLRMWAYSRIDTINHTTQLQLIREAGIRWLALGIESGNRNIRLEISKGKFKDIDVRDVIKKNRISGYLCHRKIIFSGCPEIIIRQCKRLWI